MTSLNLENLYIKSANNLIYKVVKLETVSSTTMCLRVNFELVCGWDYVSPDENDIQGYVSANMFSDSVQSESIIFYPLEELLKDEIEANDYTVIPSLPTFKIVVDDCQGDEPYIMVDVYSDCKDDDGFYNVIGQRKEYV